MLPNYFVSQLTPICSPETDTLKTVVFDDPLHYIKLSIEGSHCIMEAKHSFLLLSYDSKEWTYTDPSCLNSSACQGPTVIYSSEKKLKLSFKELQANI